MRRPLLIVVLMIFVLLPVMVTGGPARAQGPLDFDLPVAAGAHFFTQTDGQGGATGNGYAVSNADGIPFWDFFRNAGGVSVVGYPVSHRFTWNGFVVQAFQKVVFQWRPEVGTVYYVNVIDEMHNRGLDPWLQAVRQTPPPSDWSGDTGLPFGQVISRHVSLLASYPAFAAAYALEVDPVNYNGLPMAPVQDMGGVLVLRAQRKIFQQWLTDTPFARAGQVIIANGGDVGKEAGLYPPLSVTPQAAANVPLSVVADQSASTTPTPTSAAAACNGDEQMTFDPAAPVTGQTFSILVTSARPSTNIGLSGPLNPAFIGISSGGKGTLWTWRAAAADPGRYDFNFTINGVLCTSNFVQVGSPATATSTATATPSPIATATPTPTPTPTSTPHS